MKPDGTYILLIAKPGYRRKSISTSLHAIPTVNLLIADGKVSGMQYLHTLNPAIVLIDSGSMNTSDYSDLCESIKRDHPQSQCFLLVDTNKTNKKTADPCLDGFIYTNHSAFEFVQAVKSIIKRPEGTNQGYIHPTL
jgi:DNA-binding NarL/FixJ family response regulator